MKKIVAIIALAMVVCGSAYAAAPITQTSTVSITLNAVGDFNLSVYPSTMDFGYVDTGEWANSGVTITTSNSLGLTYKWALQIASTAIGDVPEANVRAYFKPGDIVPGGPADPITGTNGLPQNLEAEDYSEQPQLPRTTTAMFTPDLAYYGGAYDHQLIVLAKPTSSGAKAGGTITISMVPTAL